MTGDRTLGRYGLAGFDRRKIDAETPVKHGVYTASKSPAGEVVPDEAGKIIVFPFLEHGVEVNTKFRGPPKEFWQRPGGKKTFWNADALDEPALHDGRQALIITEGEIDALTAIDCGFPFTVSVPDGAPAVPSGKKPEELEPFDPEKDSEGKFEYLWNNRERLKKIKRFIIASDGDAQALHDWDVALEAEFHHRHCGGDFVVPFGLGDVPAGGHAPSIRIGVLSRQINTARSGTVPPSL